MKLKIKSNPYEQKIEFSIYREHSQKWEDIKENNPDSKLREEQFARSFLLFRIKEIIDTILKEYSTNGDKMYIYFEGTQDEYIEVEKVCKEDDIKDKVELFRTTRILENARVIFNPTKEIFETVQPIIEKVIKDDAEVRKKLNKVSDALKDIIPICVFGNYSVGKSTFINALIGGEVLPSGSDPVTAKVYKIKRSNYPDNARVKFSYMEKKEDKEKINKEVEFEILFEGTGYRLLNGEPQNELFQIIFNSIKKSEAKDINSLVKITLEIINGYEKWIFRFIGAMFPLASVQPFRSNRCDFPL